MDETREPTSALAGWAEAAPAANGHAPAPRRMPVRTKRLTFEDVGDGAYAGWEATVRLNPTTRQVLEWQEAQGLRANLETFLRFVVDWNFVDEDGAPLPLTPDGMLGVPDDLLGALIRGWTGALKAAGDVPKASSTPSGPT